MSPRLRSTGFGPRLLLTQALVIGAGSVTLLVVALGLMPGLFQTHLDRAVGPIPEELSAHLQIAFFQAILLALSVATAAAALTALAVSWFVTKRVVGPLTAMATAATAMTAGDYTARVNQSGLGVEFDALGQAFNHMARSIAATERTRAEILRDLAHELRTPLSTIRGYHEALAEGVLNPTAETHATVDQELTRMERLVQDIARVSSAEERRLELTREPVAAADLVATAVAAAARSFTAREVDLTSRTPEEPAVVVAVDRDRMQEVLSNLLDNALRHTPAGGRVTVTCTSQSDSVEIAVTDTGDGISAQALPRIFERFYRVDDGRSRDQGGSGIGLAITRALVQAHGGHIRADSPGPGHGATFTINLPASINTTSSRMAGAADTGPP